MSLSSIRTVLSVLESEGYPEPVAVSGIVAAHDAALDPVPVRNAAMDRLAAAIAAGDTAEAAAASVAFDSLPAVPYFANSGPVVEGITNDALMASIDAAEAYSFLAGRFTSAGRELADAIKKVDPDLPAEDAASLTSQPKRDAWASVPSLRSTLDRLTDNMVLVLHDLANVDVQSRPDARPDDRLPLCVRYPGEPEADTLFEIWTRPPRPASMNTAAQEAHPGRAGLWGDIIAAGGSIEAPATLQDIARWPRPQVAKNGREAAYDDGPSYGNRRSTPAESAFYAGALARKEAAAEAVPEVTTDALRAAAGLKGR